MKKGLFAGLAVLLICMFPVWCHAQEEYINFIRDYTYDGTRYYVTAQNGDIYCIYYVASNGNDGQKLPVPKTAKSYQISGNNIDGFIVSAHIGKEQVET